MMDLRSMIADVETEYGAERGINLGSILTRWGGPTDASEYRIGLADIAERAGWQVVCHSMVSNGPDARRYYLARPEEP